VDSYEHGTGPSGSIEGSEFLDCLSDYYEQLLKNAPYRFNPLLHKTIHQIQFLLATSHMLFGA
jgi:hypothetical protein